MSPSEDFDAAASYLSNASSLSQVSTAIKLEVLGCLLRLAKSSDSDHLVLSPPTAVWAVQIRNRITYAQHFEAGDIRLHRKGEVGFLAGGRNEVLDPI